MELIQTITPDNIILSGLYNPTENKKTAIILIHGFTGDFYSHKFFLTIQEKLTSLGVANVAIQHRGTGLKTEFMPSERDRSIYIGSFFEKLEDAHLDITGWVEFLIKEGYDDIILLGHSLGTYKAVRYLFEGKFADKVKKLILLAPFDKNSYTVVGKLKDHFDEYIKVARQKVSEGKGEEIVPPEYEDYAMSYQTYLSWYENSDLNNLWDFYRGDQYDCPILKQVKIPIDVIVGSMDEGFVDSNTSTFESAFEILKKNIAKIEYHIIENSGHCFVGHDTEVSDYVASFVLK